MLNYNSLWWTILTCIAIFNGVLWGMLFDFSHLTGFAIGVLSYYPIVKLTDYIVKTIYPNK